MKDEQLMQLATYLLEFVKRVSSGAAAEAELNILPHIAATLAAMPRF